MQYEVGNKKYSVKLSVAGRAGATREIPSQLINALHHWRAEVNTFSYFNKRDSADVNNL